LDSPSALRALGRCQYLNDGVRIATLSGVLLSTGADDPQDPTRLAAFAQGLHELGWTVGRNLRIDHRWGAGDIRSRITRTCTRCHPGCWRSWHAAIA